MIKNITNFSIPVIKLPYFCLLKTCQKVVILIFKFELFHTISLKQEKLATITVSYQNFDNWLDFFPNSACTFINLSNKCFLRFHFTYKLYERSDFMKRMHFQSYLFLLYLKIIR